MHGEPSQSSDSPLGELDRLLAACLETPRELRDARIAELAAGHPEHEHDLRERLALLEQAGLIDGAAAGHALPERLGDFRLIERLGGGGMGIVYLAEQESLGRRVALKLIRPDHLYFDGARARFRREVEAVARLEHTGIVRVHAVGEENGVPYFAMERLRGCSLAQLLAALLDAPVEALDGARLASAFAAVTGTELANVPSDRSWTDVCLWFTAQVAGALHHAHEHGIVHRDVKPSNVMLTAEGRVVLVDFGLASRADEPRLTRSGTPVGSLSYMSPEQLRGEPLDARTDVYSLGVTLYELLARSVPFTSDNSAELSAQILGGRTVPLRRRNPAIAEDALTVCEVAMDVSPSRRYATARALAEDARRFLRHLPIQARPIGRALRLRRFVQRHPTATVATVLGSILAVGVPTTLYVQEAAARSAIAEEAEAANRSADLLTEVFAELQPNRTRGEPLSAEQLMTLAAQRLRATRFATPRIQARLLLALAEIDVGLGMFEPAVGLARECLELHERLPELPAGERARAHLALGKAHHARGAYADAEAELREALGMLRAIGDGATAVACMAELGMLLAYLGQLPDAEALLRESLDLQRERHGGADDVEVARAMNAFGTFLYNAGRFEPAERELAGALAMLERLGETDLPLCALVTHHLAATERALNRLDDARRHHEQTIELLEKLHGPDTGMLAEPLEDYGGVLMTLGEMERAGEVLLRAFEARDPAAAPVGLARSLNQLGCYHNGRGEYGEALATFERSVALYRQAFPGGHRDLGIALENLASTLLALGDPAAAVEPARQSAAVHRGFDGGPSHFEVAALVALARALAASGDAGAGLATVRRAVEQCDALQPADHVAAARALFALAGLLLAQGKGGEALDPAQRGVDMLQRLFPDGCADLGTAWHLLGWAREQRGDAAGAEAAYARALELHRRFVPRGNADVAFTLNALGLYAARRGEWETARPLFAEALEIRDRGLPDAHPLLSQSLQHLGLALLRTGAPDDAERHLRRAVDLRRAHLPEPHADTASSLQALGEALQAAGRPAEAVAVLEECVALRDRLFPDGHERRRAAAAALAAAKAAAAGGGR